MLPQGSHEKQAPPDRNMSLEHFYTTAYQNLMDKQVHASLPPSINGMPTSDILSYIQQQLLKNPAATYIPLPHGNDFSGKLNQPVSPPLLPTAFPGLGFTADKGFNPLMAMGSSNTFNASNQFPTLPNGYSVLTNSAVMNTLSSLPSSPASSESSFSSENSAFSKVPSPPAVQDALSFKSIDPSLLVMLQSQSSSPILPDMTPQQNGASVIMYANSADRQKQMLQSPEHSFSNGIERHVSSSESPDDATTVSEFSSQTTSRHINELPTSLASSNPHHGMESTSFNYIPNFATNVLSQVTLPQIGGVNFSGFGAQQAQSTPWIFGKDFLATPMAPQNFANEIRLQPMFPPIINTWPSPCAMYNQLTTQAVGNVSFFNSFLSQLPHIDLFSGRKIWSDFTQYEQQRQQLLKQSPIPIHGASNTREHILYDDLKDKEDDSPSPTLPRPAPVDEVRQLAFSLSEMLSNTMIDLASQLNMCSVSHPEQGTSSGGAIRTETTSINKNKNYNREQRPLFKKAELFDKIYDYDESYTPMVIPPALQLADNGQGVGPTRHEQRPRDRVGEAGLSSRKLSQKEKKSIIKNHEPVRLYINSPDPIFLGKFLNNVNEAKKVALCVSDVKYRLGLMHGYVTHATGVSYSDLTKWLKIASQKNQLSTDEWNCLKSHWCQMATWLYRIINNTDVFPGLTKLGEKYLFDDAYVYNHRPSPEFTNMELERQKHVFKQMRIPD